MEGKMSWRTAQEWCEEQGGFLASIESQPENDFVYNTLKSLASNTQTNWWIGGNDFEEGESKWIWTSSKKRLDAGYQNWVVGQPDNGQGSYKNLDENCLSLYKSGYKTPNLWSDKRCNLWQPSICEVPNPHYNGSEALEFSHDISKYIDESLCLTDKGTPECLNGTWTCYTFVRLQKTWQQAKEFCEERGAVLAGPDSRETANAIYQKAKQYVLNSNAFYWLGASDRETENDWRWVKNNKTVPIRDRSISFSSPIAVYDTNQNCLWMEVKSYRTRMHWNDAECDNWAWFVCESSDCHVNPDS